MISTQIWHYLWHDGECACFKGFPCAIYILYLITFSHRSYVSERWMTAGCLFARSYVRPVSKCTIMHREQTAGPRCANFCTLMHVIKVYLHANFHLNPQSFRPLISRSKIRIEYTGECIRERVVSVGKAETERTVCTNRHDVKGCQRTRSIIPIAKICQGVLDYRAWFLSIAFSPIAFVWVSVCACICVYVCVCVCVRVCVCSSVWTPHWWTARKRFEINPPFLQHHVGY